MKKLLFILGISFLFIISIAGGCGFSAYRVGKSILENNFQLSTINNQLLRWCSNGLPFVDRLPQFLSNKKYVVLLQNNYEIRPSGGFMGSYIALSTQPSGLNNIQFQDIYVPDGQLIGHVDPPMPVQQSFQQGWWKLRDSNYDPDFNIAGEQIAWFFSQANEPVDGLIAINLPLAGKILEITGPIKLVDYPETITSENLYSLAQMYAEVNFFPGSTQKRDFLGAVGKELVARLKAIKPVQIIKLGKLIYSQLKTHQILVWFKDPQLQKEIQFRGWDGGLGSSANTDYLYIIDTNLGANKANCCVTRSVDHQITGLESKLQINYQNTGQFHNPTPPVFWGGDYNNFVRVILPENTEIKNIIVNNQTLEFTKAYVWQSKIEYEKYIIETRPGFTVIGFWAFTPAGETTSAIINYSREAGSRSAGQILVKRQPGLDSFHYSLSADGNQVVSKDISNDELFDKTK